VPRDGAAITAGKTKNCAGDEKRAEVGAGDGLSPAGAVPEAEADADGVGGGVVGGGVGVPVDGGGELGLIVTVLEDGDGLGWWCRFGGWVITAVGEVDDGVGTGGWVGSVTGGATVCGDFGKKAAIDVDLDLAGFGSGRLARVCAAGPDEPVGEPVEAGGFRAAFPTWCSGEPER
jgi:hypothetical protein